MISGTVMELSAMLVAKMTFLFPSSGLRNTLDCSSDDMEEWRSKTLNLKREGGREGEEEREREKERKREKTQIQLCDEDKLVPPTHTYPSFL